MELTVDRAAVSIKDDSQNHKRVFTVDPSWTWRQVLAVVLADWSFPATLGDVAWGVHILFPRDATVPNDNTHLALVRVPQSRHMKIVQMNEYWLEQKAGDTPEASLWFEYYSQGRSLQLSAFTSEHIPSR